MIKKMHFKKLLLYSSLIIIGLPFSATGQSIQRQSISCYSSAITGSGISVTQTAGQSFFTSSKNNANSVVLQGFQQPIAFNNNSKIISIEDNIDINIYPNPANSKVIITSTKELLNCKIELKNNIGGTIQIKTAENLTNGYELNCSNFPEGIYFLTVTDAINEISKTSKLIIIK